MRLPSPFPATVTLNGALLLLLLLMSHETNLIRPGVAWVPPSNKAILSSPSAAFASQRLFYRNRVLDEDRFSSASSSTAAMRLQRQRQQVRATTTATLPITTLDEEDLEKPIPNPLDLLSGQKYLEDAARHLKAAVAQRLEETKRNHIKSKNKIGNGINRLMMKNLVLSQATLLSLSTAAALFITTLLGSGNFMDALNWIPQNAAAALPFDNLNVFWEAAAAPTWVTRLLLGGVAAFPMILASHIVDSAEVMRDSSHVHFSTTDMVLSLFGRRRNHSKAEDQTHQDAAAMNAPESTSTEETTTTPQVIWSSAGLSALTSVTEEVVFRGYVPSLILALTHSPLVAWLGQALAFGLGHVHPSAQAGENRVVATTQTLNGLFGYGMVYILSGGDLWPCIIAHLLYDLHVLVSSWHNVNSQMDWTESEGDGNRQQDQESLQQLQQWAGPSLTLETLTNCRTFFYAFDVDHCNALSLGNVQRAMAYAFWKDEKQPSASQVERLFHRVLQERENTSNKMNNTTEDYSEQQRPPPDYQWDDRINLSEFVRLLFSLRAQTLKPEPTMVV